MTAILQATLISHYTPSNLANFIQDTEESALTTTRYHFRVSNDLAWREEIPFNEPEVFYDSLYDAPDFRLLRQSAWLFNRQYSHEVKESQWRLKQKAAGSGDGVKFQLFMTNDLHEMEQHLRGCSLIAQNESIFELMGVVTTIQTVRSKLNDYLWVDCCSWDRWKIGYYLVGTLQVDKNTDKEDLKNISIVQKLNLVSTPSKALACLAHSAPTILEKVGIWETEKKFALSSLGNISKTLDEHLSCNPLRKVFGPTLLELECDDDEDDDDEEEDEEDEEED